MSDSLMPGPEGKTPRFYEVDRGQKTESYIVAVSGNPVPGSVRYSKVDTEPPPALEDDDAEPKKKKKSNGQMGLTEAELERYRDDPFWYRLRLFLFILFWLLWILMFLLAMLIVFLSPGCASKIAPHWWHTAVSYQVWVPSFRDSDGDGLGDYNGLVEKLDLLRKSGVKTVWPSPFLLSDEMSESAVRDHSSSDLHLGVNTDADALIKAIHAKDMRVVVSFPVATTSLEHDWFLRSSQASLPENTNFSNFYIWKSQDPKNGFYSEYKDKKYFYLHEEANPKAAVLNWANPLVRSHILERLDDWVDRGVDGFHLAGIEYLVRNANGDEPDWPAIYEILKEVRLHVDTHLSERVSSGEEKKIVLFASREEAKEKDKLALAGNGLDSIINYELAQVRRDSKICHRSEGTVALCVYEILSDVVRFHLQHSDIWPQWEFGNQHVSRLASRVTTRAHAELLLMLQLLLPGTNSFYYGQEIGMRDLPHDSKVAVQRGAMQWDDTAHAGFTSALYSKIPLNNDYKNVNWQKQYGEERSPLKTFAKLAKLRQRDEVLTNGSTFMGKFVSQGFTLSRFGDESSHKSNVYVIALNFGSTPVSLPLNDLPVTANLAQSQIVVASSNAVQFYARQSVDFSSAIVELGAGQGVVFRFPR